MQLFWIIYLLLIICCRINSLISSLHQNNGLHLLYAHIHLSRQRKLLSLSKNNGLHILYDLYLLRQGKTRILSNMWNVLELARNKMYSYEWVQLRLYSVPSPVLSLPSPVHRPNEPAYSSCPMAACHHSPPASCRLSALTSNSIGSLGTGVP